MPALAHLSAHSPALSRYAGLKALFIQDEYENTWLASEWITRLGIQVVFTCVPAGHIRRVYSRVAVGVEFFQNLTGYLPLHIGPGKRHRPLCERPILIGYRGRVLPYHYGRLAREKTTIGQIMRGFCRVRNIPHDIEWTPPARLYGPAWIEFIGNCRTMLGTESGNNLFDHDGTLRARIQETLLRRPDITYEEIHARFLIGKEADGMMNQVSPRIFEAVALRMA